MKKIILLTILSIALTGLSACSFFEADDNDSSANVLTRDAAVSQYSAESLRNYINARDYSAQGRYELAKEHYLLALAAANDPYLQEALSKELESIDMMIKSLR